MIELPSYISSVFMLTAFLTVGIFLYAIRSSIPDRTAGYLIAAAVPFWMLFQGALALGGTYQVSDSVPPRLLVFGVLPALVFMITLFLFARGAIAELSIVHLTLIHVIRIPVELVLHWLYEHGAVAREMTFSGWNFDIISGITAIGAFILATRNLDRFRHILIGWNVVALLLVLTIVAISIASFPSPLQQIAFDQPNRAVMYFPYVWLPTIIVPIVLFSHFASLYKLLSNNSV